MRNNKGVLTVISGPSGCGKGTVVDYLLKHNDRICLSVSVTTRAMREGEQEGVSYFFRSKEEFERMIADNAFLEYNCGYSGNYYGTPRAYVEQKMREGFDVILEIEMNGGVNVKKAFPEAVMIFLAPPSLTELRRRLVGRGTDSAEAIEERFLKSNDELKRAAEYDYIIVNDEIEQAAEEIKAILTAEKSKKEQNMAFIETLIG